MVQDLVHTIVKSDEMCLFFYYLLFTWYGPGVSLAMDCEELEFTVVFGVAKEIGAAISFQRLPGWLCSGNLFFDHIPYTWLGQQPIGIAINVKHLVLRILSKQDIIDPNASLKLWPVHMCHIKVW